MKLVNISLTLVSLLMAFPVFSQNAIYEYDPLNRLKKVDYGNDKVISYDYDEAGNRKTYMVTGQTGAMTVSVFPSWNMLSLPLDVQNSAVNNIFPNVNTVWGYNSSQGWFNPTSLQFGTGYWFLFNNSGSIAITGTVKNNITLSLAAGWNLIGNISTTINFNEIVQSPPNSLGNYIWSYDAQQQRWQGPDPATTTIQPGKAYWVYALKACQITMNKSSASLKIDSVIAYENDNFKKLNALEIRDQKNRAMTLYFGKYTSDLDSLEQYLLPPRPPRGIFDARFANDRFVSATSNANEEHVIHFYSSDYPVVLKWQLAKTPIQKYKMTDGFNGEVLGAVQLSESGSLTINDPRIETVVIKSVSIEPSLPTSYTLEQNYPNPFNPETKIDFALVEQGRMKVVVYNVLGGKVRTLIDQVMEPGYHSVHWDGRNQNGEMVQSGIYFYKMTTPGFTQIRKMLLIR